LGSTSELRLEQSQQHSRSDSLTAELWRLKLLRQYTGHCGKQFDGQLVHLYQWSRVLWVANQV